jgi:hypothetical protein
MGVVVAGHGQHRDAGGGQLFHAVLELAIGDEEIAPALDHVTGQQHCIDPAIDRLGHGARPGGFRARARADVRPGLRAGQPAGGRDECHQWPAGWSWSGSGKNDSSLNALTRQGSFNDHQHNG